MSSSLITCDSRKVFRGSTYIAIRGVAVNGEDYIPEVIAKGAKRIVVQEDSDLMPYQTLLLQNHIEVIRVPNTRQHLAYAAAESYKRQPINIVGVTGTNGKTSISYFYQQLAEKVGIKSGYIGTLGIKTSNDQEIKQGGGLTSPDPITLHQLLTEMVDQGIEAVAIEASSHGLDQYRLDGVKFKAAGFTNFTRDHLDYHGTEEEYFLAKLRLFTELLGKNSTAVLNADIPEYSRLREACEQRGIKVLTYSLESDTADLTMPSPEEVKILEQSYKIDLRLVGEFQKYNVLCTIGLLIATGFKAKEICSYIGQLKAAPGRLEEVAIHNGARIFVDFAHTPDALENVLVTLRKTCKGKLYLVFGCGGDRDQGKRPEMARVAAKFADYSIITDDNPRTEDPAKIRSQIMAGVKGKLNFREIAGRSEAIEIAILELQPGDALIIAGKGHEDYQIIGTEKIPYTDHGAVGKIIERLVR